MKDTDFLFLTSMLRVRETAMLSEDKISRMLDAHNYSDAAKVLVDCGYPDLSSSGMDQVENALRERRSDVFTEISNLEYARELLNLFRIKYDYHNVKTLIKSAAAKTDAKHLLSRSGRIEAGALCEAVEMNRLDELPPRLAASIDSAAGIMARSGNPQLADIEIDKAYFGELCELAGELKDAFILGYVRLLIDTSNLRTIVRAARTGRDRDFLSTALIEGGNVSAGEIVSAGEGALSLYSGGGLEQAARFGAGAMGGGGQTGFELSLDNAVLSYVTDTAFISFGAAPVVSYLAKLEWEISAVRIILIGKIAGIDSGAIRERLRDCHV